jgi:hypothetical protein
MDEVAALRIKFFRVLWDHQSSLPLEYSGPSLWSFSWTSGLETEDDYATRVTGRWPVISTFVLHQSLAPMPSNLVALASAIV